MRIRFLSRRDAVALLEIIHASLTCSAEGQLRLLMARLSSLLHCQAGLSCIARMDQNRFAELRVVNLDYPAEYLGELTRRQLVLRDPIVVENFRTFRLQYWADTFERCPLSPATHEILSLAEDYGFARARSGCGYGHGVKSRDGASGSFFCYHGLERSQRSEEILRLVAPHFHEVLRRLGDPPARTSPAVTPREREILQWLAQGKSGWEISVILNISERTVKFHTSNILHKLNADTRAHAVAIALELGLVAFS
ncbi:LuxR C-terminal-related transcriptional regulator [Desulfurivibrio sp. D14AmB]|uniref:helix-turn-helix transcriptional regulator n=1 Tax=Desulfurivibrio sp. D14AmB TaxID=3374370 RepID=UPI00376EB7EC